MRGRKAGVARAGARHGLSEGEVRSTHSLTGRVEGEYTSLRVVRQEALRNVLSNTALRNTGLTPSAGRKVEKKGNTTRKTP